MAVDFQDLVRRNKRNSLILIGVFVLFVAGVGLVMGYAWGVYFGGGSDAGLLGGLGIMAAAAVFASLGVVGSYFGGSGAMLRMSGAREIAKSDDPQLFNIVEEMSIAAGLPMPRIYLIDDTAPNAFATGRDPQHAVVAVTTGLRTKLTREELQGVIAHEMSHIRNFDIRFAVLMSTLVGIVVLLCDMFLHTLRWGRGSSSRSRRSKDGGAIVLVVILLAVLLSIVAPLLAKLLEMAFSRQREYLADASAVDLTRNPQGLAGALVKISNDPEVLEVANRATAPLYIVHPIKRFEDRASSIMDSHPPIKDRVARLVSMSA